MVHVGAKLIAEPGVAQLAERRTVEVQQSLGRWFKFASREEFLFYKFYIIFYFFL